MGGIVLVLGGFLYLGRAKAIELDGQIAAAGEKLEDYRTRAGEKAQVEKRLQDQEDKASRYIELLPQSGEADTLVGNLGRVSYDSEVNLKSITPKRSRGKKGSSRSEYSEVEYSMELEGGFHELVLFINQIEDHFPRFLKVASITITSEGAGLMPGSKHHRIVLRVVTYVYEGSGK